MSNSPIPTSPAGADTETIFGASCLVGIIVPLSNTVPLEYYLVINLHLFVLQLLNSFLEIFYLLALFLHGFHQHRGQVSVRHVLTTVFIL